MGWSGGSYTKGNAGTGGWTGDASLGIGIEAGRHDTQDDDFATGINQCLNKDGSNSCTGDLNLGGFKPVNLAAGTAAAPAICAGGDVNTGIFSPAADQIGIATNGTERVRIDASGNVGVGITTPARAFDLIGAIRVTDNQTDATDKVTRFYSTCRTNADGDWAVIDARGVTSANNLTIGGGVAAAKAATTIFFNTAANTTTNTGTERMRINNAGLVGIGGGTNAGYRLSVYGETSTASSHSFIALNNGGNTAFRIRDDGLINTGLLGNSPYNATTGAAANVHVGGGGDLLRSTSSLKYKTDIHDYTHGLNAVNALRPVFYKGINDGDKQFAGLIAEEVHESGLTEFVVYNEQDEPDALHYGNMVALAFKAIQELNAKVEALEARVAELEAA